MTQTLKIFLTGVQSKEFAIQTGTQIHKALQRVVVDDVAGNSGAPELIKEIQNRHELKRFFGANAKTEIPIAGCINGRFVSRRIDRMIIDFDTKIIDFIDYKTDTDKNTFVDQYKHQLNEYWELLKSAYPDYKINGYILWLCDWCLNKVV